MRILGEIIFGFVEMSMISKNVLVVNFGFESDYFWNENIYLINLNKGWLSCS